MRCQLPRSRLSHTRLHAPVRDSGKKFYLRVEPFYLRIEIFLISGPKFFFISGPEFLYLKPEIFLYLKTEIFLYLKTEIFFIFLSLIVSKFEILLSEHFSRKEKIIFTAIYFSIFTNGNLLISV